MRTAWITVLLLSAALAGCSDGEAPPAGTDPVQPPVAPTKDTGIIRGVVVDDTITPIPDVTVTVLGERPQTTTTDAEGIFGFGDLRPGVHFLEFSKPGYGNTQANSDVVAGLADPPVVRVVLSEDPSTAPLAQHFKFDGTIGCSFSTTVGRSDCPDPDDLFTQLSWTEVETDGYPDWFQAELTWTGTSTLGDGLYLALDDGSTFSPMEREGSAPLMIAGDAEMLRNGTGTWKPGDNAMYKPGESLAFWINAGGSDLTKPPVCPQDVWDTIGQNVTSMKCWGYGLSVGQDFSLFTSVFYRMVPEESYRFLTDGEYVVKE